MKILTSSALTVPVDVIVISFITVMKEVQCVVKVQKVV